MPSSRLEERCKSTWELPEQGPQRRNSGRATNSSNRQPLSCGWSGQDQHFVLSRSNVAATACKNPHLNTTLQTLIQELELSRLELLLLFYCQLASTASQSPHSLPKRGRIVFASPSLPVWCHTTRKAHAPRRLCIADVKRRRFDNQLPCFFVKEIYRHRSEPQNKRPDYETPSSRRSIKNALNIATLL